MSEIECTTLEFRIHLFSSNMNREAQIFMTYEKYGARLIDSHGSTRDKMKTVPDDTVIMFLSKPGLCMIQAAGRSVSRTFFESRKGLEDFFRSGGPKHRGFKHVSDILERTHFPGEKYLDTALYMEDAAAPGVGFVKKLPLTRQQVVHPNYMKYERPPTFAETSGPLVYGQTILLSKLIAQTGPGIYIIAACRLPSTNIGKPANNLPTNTPHPSGWPYVLPISGARRFRRIPTGTAKPGVKKILSIPKPLATTELIRKSEMESLKKYKNPKSLENKIKNVLAHMTRNFPVSVRNVVRQGTPTSKTSASNNQLRKYIAPLPASTNVNKLRQTLGVLSNKNSMSSFFRMLPLREKARFLAQPSKRGEIIYTLI